MYFYVYNISWRMQCRVKRLVLVYAVTCIYLYL